MAFKGKETTNARIIPTNPKGPNTKWRAFVRYSGESELTIKSSIALAKRFKGKDIDHGFDTIDDMNFEIGAEFPTLKLALAFAKAIKNASRKSNKKRKS